ncbi:MAG: rod shape-determining protein MreD [Acetilactobacillus jinshanensis]
MIKNSSLKYVFPIGLLIAFFLDGSISYNLMPILYRSYSMVPYLSLFWLLMAIFFAHDFNLHVEGWAALLGAFFDWYYVGIWGVFIFIFPLVVYFTRVLYRYFSINFLSALLIYLVDLIMVLFLGDIADRIVSHITGVAAYTGINFIFHSAIPTLVLNAVLFAILYFPVQKLYNYCQRS